MFKKKAYVVYPMYGVCQVTAMEKHKFDGKTIEFYVLECEMENITLKVPVDGVKNMGIRKIISRTEADEFLKMLQRKPADIEDNWKIRYQENVDKLKTGRIKEAIEVARGLFIRNRFKELSSSEKRLYEKAYQFIVDEISIALKKDKESIEDIVSGALEKSAKKFEHK
ncbi:MAG: transcriptional regulator [Spirochaetes bacterium]|nr:transcriptional regulator [Spirochaetota bacterium]